MARLGEKAGKIIHLSFPVSAVYSVDRTEVKAKTRLIHAGFTLFVQMVQTAELSARACLRNSAGDIRVSFLKVRANAESEA